jgi:hypothetical protein
MFRYMTARPSPYTEPMHHATLAAAAASMTWLVACAGPAATPAVAGAELRVIVKLNAPSSDTRAITERVAAAAGTPARYLAASSPQWHALALQCADAKACEAAFQRLGANEAAFETVQRDERRRIVKP